MSIGLKRMTPAARDVRDEGSREGRCGGRAAERIRSRRSKTRGCVPSPTFTSQVIFYVLTAYPPYHEDLSICPGNVGAVSTGVSMRAQSGKDY